MSRYERFGTRSLLYSNWHRYYLDGDNDTMIDVDGLEYCHVRGCSQPLILVETAMDYGQAIKPTTVLRKLAEKASVVAFCVLYTPTFELDQVCPCAESDAVDPACDHGISAFRVRRITPDPTAWIKLTPEKMKLVFRTIRDSHIQSHHQSFQGVA